MVRRWAVGAVVAAVTASTALSSCATGGAPSPAPDPPSTSAGSEPSPPSAAAPTSPPSGPPPTPPPPATPSAPTASPATGPPPTPPASAALAFFRAQERPCEEFARRMGIVGVEPDRFRGATVVRELAGGATQIRDGRGTRLVVVPRRGIVLPASGRPDDVMPPPYGFGCSEKVFVGASQD